MSIILPPLSEYPPLKLVILCTIQPSEHDTYADIEAVYECLQTEYGVSQEDLILYGQSVGSGPTLHLAAKLPRLRGVVLHSAILSGLRVLCQLKVTLCFDIYKVSISRSLHQFVMSILFFFFAILMYLKYRNNAEHQQN